MLPLPQDRWLIYAFLAVMMTAVPIVGDDYWLSAILIPLMVFSLAALGLNIVTGYTGQLSLGTGGFMLMGSIMTYNFIYRFDGENIPFDMPLPLAFIMGGIVTGLAGVIFGLPSIRIKGFYLIVSTLAGHYFLLWFFTTYTYFVNHDRAGVVLLSSRYYEMSWITLDPQNYYLPALTTINLNTTVGKYYLVLMFVIALTVLAKNLTRGAFGRNMMAVRDMDIAASVIGIRVATTKLLAFFISTFYIGIAGALFSFSYTTNIDLRMHELDRAFQVLFMIIIGGLSTISGAFLGAIFVYLFDIVIGFIGAEMFGNVLDSAFVENLAKVLTGVVIIVLLIKEPGGFAALWQRYKEKLRSWPFASVRYPPDAGLHIILPEGDKDLRVFMARRNLGGQPFGG